MTTLEPIENIGLFGAQVVPPSSSAFRFFSCISLKLVVGGPFSVENEPRGLAAVAPLRGSPGQAGSPSPMKRAGKPARVDQGAASRADLHQAAEIHAGTCNRLDPLPLESNRSAGAPRNDRAEVHRFSCATALVRGGVPPPCQPLRGSNSTPLWEGKPSPRFAAPPTQRLAARSARKEGRPGLCQWRKVARHRRPKVDAKKERALERIGEPLAGF